MKENEVLPEKKVIFLCDFNGEDVRLSSIEDIKDWLETDLSDRMRDGVKDDDKEYMLTVEIEYMTQTEIDALPEY